MVRELHVVSHSHWDREWHQTFQQFRLRLVRLVDKVLEMLDADPALSFFMLDGQTIVLEDYLEIRPEQRTTIGTHIADGRLLIGPWYVHPDEFLVSGEALVRNLLQGARLCTEWGGSMAVGYVPDQFGHIAQLPQILCGFGIDSAVLWRGIDLAETSASFTWEAPDGSSVLTVALPEGYNQAEHLPHAGAALADRLRALAAILARHAPDNRPLLIMHGGDHSILSPQLPTALREAEAALRSEYRVLESTLPRYVRALRAAGQPATRLQGELRSSRSAFLLPGVASSRMWIKQRNATAQRTLERQAEPLATAATLLGEPDRGAELRQAWRYLLQNQPHDSISGCGIDQVHREMVTRFDWSEQIAHQIRDEALAALARHVDTAIPGAEDPRTLALVVFNGTSAARSGTVSLTLSLAGEATGYELVDAHGASVAHLWEGERGEPPTVVDLPIEDLPDRQTIMEQVDGNRVMGMGLQDISMRTVGDTLHLEVTVGDQAILSRAAIEQAMQDAEDLVREAQCTKLSALISRSIELRLTALVPSVPSFGYTTLLLRPRTGSSGASPAQTISEALPLIENERYRVEADATSGALTVTDRASGLRIGPACVFVDDGEAGDLYTHCPPASDTIVRADPSPRILRESGPLGQHLHLHHILQVPVSLAESRVERSTSRVLLPATTTVTLLPADDLIRFRVTVDNQAQDHRLRVHTTVPFAADHAHASCAFGMVRRAAQPSTVAPWAELPTGAAPHQGVVALHDETSAFLLSSRGLPEYEVLPQADGSTQLALTLLRCTGWLSRGDLPVRPGDAGPPLLTPEAQCPGVHTFEFALCFGRQDWRTMLASAQASLTDLCCASLPPHEGSLPAQASLVEIHPAAIVLSAFKGAEDGRGVILRLFNDDAIAHGATIRLLTPVERVTRVTLAEQDEEVLYEGKARYEFALSVPAARIVTLRLEARRSPTVAQQPT